MNDPDFTPIPGTETLYTIMELAIKLASNYRAMAELEHLISKVLVREGRPENDLDEHVAVGMTEDDTVIIVNNKSKTAKSVNAHGAYIVCRTMVSEGNLDKKSFAEFVKENLDNHDFLKVAFVAIAEAANRLEWKKTKIN